MAEPQFIEEDGVRKFAVIPIDTWEEILDRLEDLEDSLAIQEWRESGGEMLPAEMVNRLLDGENKVRVWREHRGLTQQALADKAGLSKPYLSQIEAGKREPTVKTYRALAAAIEIDLDDLLPSGGS